MFILILFGIFIGYALFAVSLINYFENRNPKMETYTFTLYRRLHTYRNDKLYPVISNLAIERKCEDPFVERIKLGREYPGWAVGNEFISGTDEEYRSLMEEANEYRKTLGDELKFRYKVDDDEWDESRR